jgi:hypothetical protein
MLMLRGCYTRTPRRPCPRTDFELNRLPVQRYPRAVTANIEPLPLVKRRRKTVARDRNTACKYQAHHPLRSRRKQDDFDRRTDLQ